MKISQSAVARLFGARFIHCLAARARCSERTVHIQGAMHPIFEIVFCLKSQRLR